MRPSEDEASRLEQVAALFEELRECSDADREARLNDPSLAPDVKAELAELFACYYADISDSGELISIAGKSHPVLDSAPEEAAGEVIRASFDGFRLLRVLGEGGSGVVWLAEQDRPRRLVAIKMLRPGTSARNVAKRLEREMEILGSLDHPCIARVFQAGETDLGFGLQPYFAMEFVDGAPITEYARARRLGTRDRLHLLAEVIAAVEHAHERGVIHRDLKPENVLVDGEGRPRVLDFGIARLAGVERDTLRTATGQIVGTMGFMSPEQLAGDQDSIDARSDVYALGAMMFELLTDQAPFDLTGRPLTEALRVLREEDPVPLGSVDRSFRGDLERICQVAMAREPARRYASAAAMGDDIARYQESLPVRARAPGPVYRMNKFVRRHRALVGSVTMVILVLSVATVVSLRFAVEATRGRESAATAAAEARRQAAMAMVSAVAADLRGGNIPAAASRLEQLDDAYRNWWEVRYLRAAVDTSEVIGPVLDKAVTCIVGFGDARWIIGDVSGAVHLVDAEGAAVDLFVRHPVRLAALSVYRDPAEADSPAILISACMEGELHATDVRGDPGDPGPAMKRWSHAFAGVITGLEVAAGRNVVAVALASGLVQLIDVRDGRMVVERVMGRGTQPLRIAAAPDGGRFAVTTADGIEILDAADLSSLTMIPAGGATITACRWTHDGENLIVGRGDGILLRLDAESGALRHRTRIPAAGAYVFDLVMHPQLDIAAIAVGGDAVAIWDLRISDEARLLAGPRRNAPVLAWSDDGEALVAGGDERQLRRWMMREFNRDRLQVGRGIVSGALLLSSDGDSHRLVLGDVGGRLNDINLETGLQRELPSRLGTVITSIAPSARGDVVHVVGSGRGIWRWRVDADVAEGPWVFPDLTPAVIRDAGQHLLIAGGDGLVLVCTPEGEEIRRERISSASIHAMEISPDRQWFAAASFDHTVVIGSAADPSVRIGLRVEGASALHWSPDGTVLWIGDQSGSLHAIDPVIGAVLRSAPIHGRGIFVITQLPEGDRLMTGSTDRTVRVIDTQTLREVLVLSDHLNAVRWLGVLPDGTLLSAGLDGQVLRHPVGRRE